MGQFSWIKSDTGETILSGGGTAKMLAPDGRVWVEENYEGYGVFGGKDFYELVAELNLTPDELLIRRLKTRFQEVRSVGIGLVFNDNPSGDSTTAAAKGVICPKLVSLEFSGSFEDADYNETCPDQGWISEDDDPEDEECIGCGYNLFECECGEEDDY